MDNDVPSTEAAAISRGRVVLVRHGETGWSRSWRHTGRTDVPLTTHGADQARALAPVLAEWTFAEVRVSPLTRARDTAKHAGLDRGEVVVDDDLQEWDYGAYEGLTSVQIHETDPEWTIFADDAPGGEFVEQVEERVDAVLARVRPVLDAGGDVALVAHGHLLRVLAARWVGESGRFGAHLSLDAGSLSILDVQHDVPLLQRWNQVPYP